MLSIEADDEAKTVVSETEWALNQSETESVGKGFVCTLYTEQKNEAFNDSVDDLPYTPSSHETVTEADAGNGRLQKPCLGRHLIR